MKSIGSDENSSWALLQKCRDFLIAEIRHVIDLSLVGVIIAGVISAKKGEPL
jgi:hypothetical protein